ncbi:aspartate kinase [Thiomicrorhabdus sp. ZW0627]|uniref:aspartate kinase n=1 Tax=Thiomicrorhabdus sp. ZW0627 TaxID=3039774 RepID=UPI00243672FA|nr:aspartate kinase [Thiomicrorhabdus sp. ZW0627]MDG6773527.1 aspartate kinase [Thiomicrorhabdus sp. ZW0627]
MSYLTVEKIGGTSMSDYQAVRDNIILYPQDPYQRIFVVSAYGGITDDLLEHKKTGQPGVYGLFANDDVEDDWRIALDQLSLKLNKINAGLFADESLRSMANAFIDERIAETKQLLNHLQDLCSHGHFSLENHLLTVRELLASLGEAHSAWNLAHLLQTEGVNARFVDLTGWQANETLSLDEMIHKNLGHIDFSKELPIVTGYAHCSENLMNTFDRGYSEMTFSRIAVMTQAAEAVIHKEYHLSSADPRLVGEKNVVPIGKTNYDISDQLANLGMEAIHPRAAKGLRQAQIPLRIKNTFEPEHHGTLITDDYVSESPQVEIIAGMKNLIAVEVFDQDMLGQQANYEHELLNIIQRVKTPVVTKDFNANTITLYVNASLKKVKRLTGQIETAFPSAALRTRKVSLVSAMGSDMAIKGLLAKAVQTLYAQGLNIEAIHQNTRQVEMQFMVNENDYETAVRAMHADLIEVHDHGTAICAH